MATYTSNYAWTKPSGNDQVDISVLNDNLDSQDAIMHKAFNNMAQAFSQLSTYAVGDIVLYDNELYKCHTAVTTPGSWTGSTNWTSWTLAEGGGGGGTSDYTDLRNKPSINGVTLTGNKTTSDLGIDKTAVGLGNVPNVATNDQTPTFTEASTRNNIASGEKLSVILGKVQKFFNDLKTVAFSGNYADLSNKPTIPTKIKYDKLLDQKSIPTVATSYNCNWSNYDLLIIYSAQYNNRTSSIIVPKDYFAETTSGKRPIIRDSFFNKTYWVYKNTDTSVYIMTDSTNDETGVIITGIRLTN